MRTATILLAALTLVACRSLPDATGDGALRFVRTPWMPEGYGLGSIRPADGDRYLLVRSGRSWLVYDGELRLMGVRDGLSCDLVPAEDRPVALTNDMVSARLVPLPSLGGRQAVPPPPRAGWLFAKAVPWAGGGGFLVATDGKGGPGLAFLGGDPPDWKWSADGALTGVVRDLAVDETTATFLRLSYDEPRLELFDLRERRTRMVLDLPAMADIALVAAGGAAFVGLEDGRILPVDLRREEMLPPIAGRGGSIALARSRSGDLVVAAWQARGKDVPRPWPATLAVYRRDGTSLLEVASVAFDLDGVLNDVAILEDRGEVLFTAGRDLIAWRWR